jgi:hypothetical protein
MHAEFADLLKRIAAGEWDDDVESELREAVADFADDFGYALDADGMPSDERDDERAPAAAESGDEDDDADEDETADEPEKEAATA